MKFESVAEAFNFYRAQSVEAIENRAAEIDKIIDTDPKADIKALNMELDGMKQAKENIEVRAAFGEKMKSIKGDGLQKITGTGMKNVVFGDDVTATKEYRSAFYKFVMGQKLNDTEKSAWDAAAKLFEKRSDSFNASTDTAAVIPDQTLNEVVKKARKQGGLLAEARAFAIPSKVSIPVGTPADKAAWHTEGAAVGSDKASLTTVNFDANEIIKVFSISTKVNTMSIDAFESYLTDELVACVMDTLNDGLVNGTGSGQGTGLEKGITWTKDKNLFTATDYKGLAKAFGKMQRGYAAGAKVAMNNATLYSFLYGMTDSQGRPVIIADPKAESIGKLFGHDIVIDDNIADDTIYVGNFSQYMGYNLPNGIVVESSRESSFKSGLIDYRALAIADCKPIVDEAFIKISTAATTA